MYIAADVGCEAKYHGMTHVGYITVENRILLVQKSRVDSYRNENVHSAQKYMYAATLELFDSK